MKMERTGKPVTHHITPRFVIVFCLTVTLIGAACRQGRETATADDATAAQQRSRQIISNADSAHDQMARVRGEATPQASSVSAAGGSPIDTSEIDRDIKRLEAGTKKNTDANTTQQLAKAYAARAAKLTGVRQYRAALGDWRRAARIDPANSEAREMVGTITSILQSMNRPVPAPGTEPTPLPLPKQG